MGGLRVHLEGYRAIAKADIALAELTVLAGVNASGKSTLARLFHHVVEVNRNFEVHATMAAIVGETFPAVRAFLELTDSIGIDKKVVEPITHALFYGRSNADIKRAQEAVEALASNEDFLSRVNGDRRIVEAFNRTAKTEVRNAVEIVSLLTDKLTAAQSRLAKYLCREVDSLPFWVRVSPDNWRKPQSLQVWDGDTPIFDNKDLDAPVPEIYSPKRSIYIRHELGAASSVYEQGIRMDGEVRVLEFGGASYPLKEQLEWMPTEISFMDGHFEAPPNKDSVGWGEWCYVRKDGATFRYADCAEGIKALAPLQVLDSYGLLDSNTLLILDEPEVHLHPQWIVRCAKSLVNLVAERRVRVLVASHSPYLIQALQRFAAQALGKGQFRFYLAEEVKDVPFGYTYRDLGEKIGPIFKTFNVALDRIASYEVSGEE